MKTDRDSIPETALPHGLAVEGTVSSPTSSPEAEAQSERLDGYARRDHPVDAARRRTEAKIIDSIMLKLSSSLPLDQERRRRTVVPQARIKFMIPPVIPSPPVAAVEEGDGREGEPAE